MSLLNDLGGALPIPLCLAPYTGGPQLTDVCPAGSTNMFLTVLNAVLIASPEIGDACGRIEPVWRPRLSYDFIVVGAGAAGPVVASRLSEVYDWSVLLVEAGPDEPAGAAVPSLAVLYLGSELDWKYRTTNESFACLSSGGSCYWPRGKNLGGCTMHHGMAYHRGNKKDFDSWAEAGNEGWGWDDVLPVFKKSEDNREIGRVSAKDHGVGGPMVVERFPWQPEFAKSVLAAAEETGYGVTEDLAGDKSTGFTVAQTTSKNGVRQSSVTSFIRPVRDRLNLDVAINALATKINFVGKKAVGIELEMNGRTHRVQAKREVILSAGSINSPQLLLLSGVGPKKHLKDVKVPVVHDLPGVGENLHNHQSFGVDFTVDQQKFNGLNLDSAEQYAYNQTGPMSGTGMSQVTGMVASKLTTRDDPDIQIFCSGFKAACGSKSGSDGSGMPVRFTSVNVHPTARGRLTLRDKNPHSHPIIWSNDLGTLHDRQVIVDGIHVIMNLANTTAMRNVGLKMIDEVVEQCAHHEKYSDDYWMCAITYKTRPENHQSGTCKMGPASDPMAVVSPRLKVHGVEGLRVADASIMPRMVSGNPVATITMIGERAAEFIKKDWLA
ncbi:glucose dehydrogenase [FAD, quinone]-like [Lasioglossum baleicum]|uniref:glucose dehydrogenase [FAD, quinone]-like n=1 Tax=Lasioglossum baleicum TaxID=434251 RepID=UPI003FCDF705